MNKPAESASEEDAGPARNRALINLAGAGFGALITLVNEVLAARFLGVSTYGLFAIGMLLAKISELISNFGMPLTVMHFIPLYRERGERSKAVDIVLAAICLPLVLALTLTLTLWLSAPFIAGSLFGEPGATDFIRLLALAIPLLSLTEIIGQITRAYGFAQYFVLIRNVIPPVCYSLLLLSLLLLEAPVIGIALAFVTAYFVALGFGFRVLYRVVGERPGAYRTDFHWGEYYRYAYPIFLSVLLFMVFRWTDIFVVGVYLDAASIGRFRGCLQVVIVFELISMSIGAAVAHQYSVLARAGDLARTQEVLSDNIRWITLLIAPVSVLIAFNSSEILGFMGKDFTEAKYVLVLMALAYTAKSLGTSLGLVLMITGAQAIEIRNAVIVVIVNLVLNFSLVPYMGIMGAAMATLASSILFTLIRIYSVKHKLSLNYPVLTVLRMIVITYGAGAFIYCIMPLVFDVGAMARFVLLVVALAIVTWKYSLSHDDRMGITKLIGHLRK